MTTASTAKILDKLAKLKAQAASEAKLGNTAAAEAFASMVNRLLLEHELNEADIELNVRDDDPIVEISVDRDAYGISRVSRRVAWQEALARLVADAHLCKFLVRSGTNFITFVGTQGHAAMAEFSFGVLVNAADRLSIKERVEWAKTRRAEGNYAPEDFRGAWLQGFVERIAQRFREEKRKAVQQAANQSTALIRLDQALVKASDYINDKYKRKATGLEMGGSGSNDGYAAGKRAADRMNIGQRGVGAGTSTKLLS